MYDNEKDSSAVSKWLDKAAASELKMLGAPTVDHADTEKRAANAAWKMAYKHATGIRALDVPNII